MKINESRLKSTVNVLYISHRPKLKFHFLHLHFSGALSHISCMKSSTDYVYSVVIEIVNCYQVVMWLKAPGHFQLSGPNNFLSNNYFQGQ